MNQTAEERETAGRVDATGHQYSGSSAPDVWWQAHFQDAADQIVEFFGGDGISLTGRRVADIGCGDGIIDLALALQAAPERIVGFDVRPTDTEHLARLARERAAISELPENLSFVTSEECRLPAEDGSFDFVVSWSAFEHIADPTAVLREVRRILRPEGVLFIQLWPFYDSAHGSHLVDWYPEGFAQYRHRDEEISHTLRAEADQLRGAEMLEAYRTLNRITADDLHAALVASGFRTAKLALQADAVHLPAEVSHLPFSHVGISGIKLLAIKAPEADGGSGAGDVAQPPHPPANLGLRATRRVHRALVRLGDALRR